MNLYISGVIVIFTLSYVSAQKTVFYRVEYNEDDGKCGGINPPPLTINAPYLSTALDIMQLAVDKDKEYKFAATYFNIGYYIDAIGGIRDKNSCYWFFYVRSPDDAETKPDVGVSVFIPGINFTVILRYEQFHNSSMIKTAYKIEYPTPMCSTVTPPGPVIVTIPTKSSALILMQEAVKIYGSSYQFSGTYFGSNLGYYIDSLNGTSSNLDISCYWNYFITTPDGEDLPADLGVSSYIIPGDDYTITWRYVVNNRRVTP